MTRVYDFSITADYHDIGNAPSTPGAYVLVAKFTGAIVYVGQAKNVRARLPYPSVFAMAWQLRHSGMQI